LEFLAIFGRAVGIDVEEVHGGIGGARDYKVVVLTPKGVLALMRLGTSSSF
jgi:hypothetical protein